LIAPAAAGAGAKVGNAALTLPIMSRKTRDLRVEIARLNRLIARIKAKPGREWTVWSSTLHDLIEERELLGMVVLNRRIEAGKKVVSFRRWRDGPWA
jgi:hypothetical protein